MLANLPMYRHHVCVKQVSYYRDIADVFINFKLHRLSVSYISITLKVPNHCFCKLLAGLNIAECEIRRSYLCFHQQSLNIKKYFLGYASLPFVLYIYLAINIYRCNIRHTQPQYYILNCHSIPQKLAECIFHKKCIISMSKIKLN